MRKSIFAGIALTVGLPLVAGQAWAQSAPDTRAQPAVALPASIPLFPLPDVVLFPNVSLPLRIFEPRYRAMVADALKGNKIIGMVTLRPGYEADYEGRPPVFPVGCAGVITEVESLPNGEYTLVLRGLEKFRVTSENPGGAYRMAQITPLPEAPPDDAVKAAIQKERLRLDALLARAFDRLGIGPAPPDLSDENLIIGLTQILELDPIELQGLLEQESVLARLRTLVDRLEMALEPPPGSRVAFLSLRAPRAGEFARDHLRISSVEGLARQEPPHVRGVQ